MGTAKISIIMEWSNTEFASVAKALRVLRELRNQWEEMKEDALTARQKDQNAEFTGGICDRPELIIASGFTLPSSTLKELREISGRAFALTVHTWIGVEYYPLKNLGAKQSGGDILLFLDSDVLPDPGWLASILGCFSDPSIEVCQGRTYVKPNSLFGKAFACGWIYDFKSSSQQMVVARKFFANNVAFRRDVFMPDGFPVFEAQTRGSGSALVERLDKRGIVVWENTCASVAHPPPAGWRHLVIRAMAESRDRYVRTTTQRDIRALRKTLALALRRYVGAVQTMQSRWSQLGGKPKEVPGTLLIISAYYFCFAAGAMLCYINPNRMISHFRI